MYLDEPLERFETIENAFNGCERSVVFLPVRTKNSPPPRTSCERLSKYFQAHESYNIKAPKVMSLREPQITQLPISSLMCRKLAQVCGHNILSLILHYRHTFRGSLLIMRLIFNFLCKLQPGYILRTSKLRFINTSRNIFCKLIVKLLICCSDVILHDRYQKYCPVSQCCTIIF